MGERCGERDQRQRRRYRQTDSQTDRKGHTAMLRNVLLSEKFDIVLRVVTCLLWINIWEGFALIVSLYVESLSHLFCLLLILSKT